MSTHVRDVKLTGARARGSRGTEKDTAAGGSLRTTTARERPAVAGPGTQGARCERCGQAARVHILEGYAQGQPIQRRFCLQCAPGFSPALPSLHVNRARLRITFLVGVIGVVLGTVGVFGDAFVPEGHAGFGWYQRAGVLLGALFVFVGILLRADLIALGGLLLFGGSLCADWVGLTRAPGIGWKQQALLGVSAACVVIALLGRCAAVRANFRAVWPVLRGPKAVNDSTGQALAGTAAE